MNHTTGLRQCCQAQYAAAGRFDKSTNPTVKTMYESFKVSGQPRPTQPEWQQSRALDAGSASSVAALSVKPWAPVTQGKQMADLMDKVLAMFPPMLHKFFQSGWPEPAAWFNARLAFTRTAAVWSMVGHVLGLGDRHGENIMVDLVTGDCVHIDFACLFDKVLSSSQHRLRICILTRCIHTRQFPQVCP